MVKITFHDSVNEIGGNKILIEDKAKIFLDSGDIRMQGQKKRRS
jgi:hypothetical protein